jgi:ATP/maltotriose-dependent transcriptional regulator MalT
VSTRRCRLLVSIGDRPVARRYHPLVREFLQSELKWRDQQRYIRLHREAAEIWQRRGDLNAAYRHLNLIGDVATANNLVLASALVRLDPRRRPC